MIIWGVKPDVMAYTSMMKVLLDDLDCFSVFRLPQAVYALSHGAEFVVFICAKECTYAAGCTPRCFVFSGVCAVLWCIYALYFEVYIYIVLKKEVVVRSRRGGFPPSPYTVFSQVAIETIRSFFGFGGRKK